MAEYRILQRAEWPGAVELWSRVFRLDAPFFTSLLEGGGPDDNVSVAALEDGRVMSSVHVFMRSIRDREGRPLKVGGIGSVSTDPEHRKQGHSGRLIEMAIEAMERAGCVWSLLGTGVNDHYARYGWRTVSTPDPWGRLRDLNGEATVLLPDDATLAAMAPLYEATSVTRPMATVRSERVWRTAIRFRLSQPNDLALGAYDGDRLAAYAVARAPWGKWAVVEAAGDAARYPALFGALADHLRTQGADRVLGLLPQGPAMDAFASVVESLNPAESRSEMVRPIANRISWPDLFALYGDPRGRHCDLDAF